MKPMRTAPNPLYGRFTQVVDGLMKLKPEEEPDEPDTRRSEQDFPSARPPRDREACGPKSFSR